MYPYFTAAQWASIKIAAGSIALGLFIFRIVAGPNYEIRNQGERIPSTGFTPYEVKTFDSMLQSDAEIHAAIQLDSFALRHVADREIKL